MQMKMLVAILLIALMLIAASMTYPTDSQIDWWTVDGGGGVSSGGSYSLSATIGQSDPGMLSGGNFLLTGGFWGGAFVTYNLNLPLVVH